MRAPIGGAQVFVQQLLHRPEQLHADLFRDDGVRAPADLHVALVRDAAATRMPSRPAG
jgi:hypothetical protein